MRLNESFLIHDTGSGEILIPVGEESKSFHGIVKLNETGSIIVHLLEKDDLSIEDILSYFYKEYPDTDKGEINESVEAFIKELSNVHAIR